MKRAVATALALLILSGCTHNDSDSEPSFDASQDWEGSASPVLNWNDAQRLAFLDEYADAANRALDAAGLDAHEDANATAVDAFHQAQAVGPVVPRPFNEITLLNTAKLRTGQTTTPSQESALLDTAWNTCKQLKTGVTYADAVYAAADANSDANDPSQLAAVLYAPLVCPEYANAALTAIAGIDGIDTLK